MERKKKGKKEKYGRKSIIFTRVILYISYVHTSLQVSFLCGIKRKKKKTKIIARNVMFLIPSRLPNILFPNNRKSCHTFYFRKRGKKIQIKKKKGVLWR